MPTRRLSSVPIFSSQAAAKPRGTHAKFTPENQAAIAKYAFLHGNKAVIRHFSKKLGNKIKNSSVSTWKKKYSEGPRGQRYCSFPSGMVLTLHQKPHSKYLCGYGSSLDSERCTVHGSKFLANAPCIQRILDISNWVWL